MCTLSSLQAVVEQIGLGDVQVGLTPRPTTLFGNNNFGTHVLVLIIGIDLPLPTDGVDKSIVARPLSAIFSQ